MASTLMHPGWGLRGRVVLKRGSLVRRLAAGASPSDALVEQLLCDGGSPLYTESPDETLEGAIRRARAALLLK